METNEIIKKLNSVNWNFDFSIKYSSDSIHPFNCRKHYSYPATFIPEIPYTLIEILSKENDVVLDPFGGIGTTFMQALTLKRYPFSFDINVIVSNVCLTFYRLFNPKLNIEKIKNDLLEITVQYDNNTDYSFNLPPYREELREWFEPGTFNELAFLFRTHDKIIEPLRKATVELVLSSILTTLSSQNKGWAYIADNVKPKTDELRKKDVFKQYKTSLNSVFNDVCSQVNLISNAWHDYDDFYTRTELQERVFQNSILCKKWAEPFVDLIITSPPYPKMIDYVKSQRLAFYFYKKNFHDYAIDEIGARYRRTRKDALACYVDEMKKYIDKMSDALKEEAFLCLILPDFSDAEKEKERKKSIQDVIDYCDNKFEKIYEISRYIPSNKRTLSIQWATLVNERIYIYRKG